MSAPRRHASGLETISVVVDDEAVPLFEQAFATVCTTVGIFEADENQNIWRVEGVKNLGAEENTLQQALMVARTLTGVEAELTREPTQAEGWVARTYEAFPEQRIGRRFVIRGTHLVPEKKHGRLTVTLDAGIAFGSGEHGSTRGCLRALDHIAHSKPRRILDMGCGSGILAMAAAQLFRRKVLAVDIEPWSVRVTSSNAQLNGLSALIEARYGNGWHTPSVRATRPFDLVFANILARPLCRMAQALALHLSPGGVAILSGLLGTQMRMVLAAHRRQGLVLEKHYQEGEWSTLVLRAHG